MLFDHALLTDVSGKPRGAVGIKPFEHFQFADHRHIVLGGRI